MLSFKQYILEDYNQYIDVFTKKQRTALAKNKDHQKYIANDPFKKIYVRKDSKNDGLYHVANQDQKHIMRVHISRHGKIYGYRIDRKSTNKDDGPWIPHKTVGEF